jgi:hypothetical protein
LEQNERKQQHHGRKEEKPDTREVIGSLRTGKAGAVGAD